MSYLNANSSHTDVRRIKAFIVPALLAALFLFSPSSYAMPISVNIYGVPYFSLNLNRAIDKPEWSVLTGAQNIEVDLGDGKIEMHAPRNLATRDLTGASGQFSLLNLSLNLAASDDFNAGEIDYLYDNQIGTFNLLQVIRRTPAFNPESALSLLFWGIDYANGAGFVLGLESVSSLNTQANPAAVNEPSMIVLLVIGFSACLLSRRRSVPGIQCS